MENKYESIVRFLAVLLILLTGCKEMDFKGMFIPEESANERFVKSMEWNNIYPFREIVTASDNYSILCASDIHAGTTTNLDRFHAIAGGTNISAVVMAGDLTWGREEDYDEFQKHLPDDDLLPVFLIAGNHDINFNGWNHFFTRFGSSTYLFKIKTPTATDLFICLETGGATLGKKQFDWLRDVLLKERPVCRNCIIITHTNFFRFYFSEASNPLTEELITLLELFIRHRVDMVIAGHSHIQDEFKFGNTTYIVMPPLKDNHPGAGYFRLDMKAGKPEFSFESL